MVIFSSKVPDAMHVLRSTPDLHTIRQPVQLSISPCLPHVDHETSMCRNIGPKSYPCLPDSRSLHRFSDSFLTCKPYGANLHFCGSCHALPLHPTGFKPTKGTRLIRHLHRVQISSSYSQRPSLQNPANDTMSGPRPQTHAPLSKS